MLFYYPCPSSPPLPLQTSHNTEETIIFFSILHSRNETRAEKLGGSVTKENLTTDGHEGS